MQKPDVLHRLAELMNQLRSLVKMANAMAPQSVQLGVDVCDLERQVEEVEEGLSDAVDQLMANRYERWAHDRRVATGQTVHRESRSPDAVRSLEARTESSWASYKQYVYRRHDLHAARYARSFRNCPNKACEEARVIFRQNGDYL